MLPCWLTVLYILAATGASVFYGCCAVAIFTTEIASNKPRSWRWHQRWFNFLGSTVGWLCLWFVLIKLWPHLIRPTPISLSWPYVGLAFVGFVGVTGNLPWTVAGLANALGALVGKVAGEK
jgi:hypothetical protein